MYTNVNIIITVCSLHARCFSPPYKQTSTLKKKEKKKEKNKNCKYAACCRIIYAKPIDESKTITGPSLGQKRHSTSAPHTIFMRRNSLTVIHTNCVCAVYARATSFSSRSILGVHHVFQLDVFSFQYFSIPFQFSSCGRPA